MPEFELRIQQTSTGPAPKRRGESVRSAVFLDRDGVIIRNVMRDDGTWGSARSRSQISLVPGVKDFLDGCKSMGFALVVVTNQPDVARGKISLSELEEIHSALAEALSQIDSFYSCVHDQQEGCSCRKPKPGMILRAAQEMDIDLQRSWLIGDRAVDIGAAHAAGVKGICVPADYRGEESVRICDSALPHFEAEGFEDALREIMTSSA